MTGTYNKAIVIGHLGDDPRIISLNGDSEMAVLRLATSTRYRNKEGGEPAEKTEWHNAAIFAEGLIDNVVKPFLSKGRKILVEGPLTTRKYAGKDGVERYETSIRVEKLELMDSKKTSA